MKRLVFLIACLLVAVPACSSPRSTTQGGGSTVLNVWELRYKLLAKYPNHLFCDPDLYPVARVGGGNKRALDWYKRQSENSPEIRVIFARLNIHPPIVDDATKVRVFKEHQQLESLGLTKEGNAYSYALQLSEDGIGRGGSQVQGIITATGEIQETAHKKQGYGCPICLERDTRIATPLGLVLITTVKRGTIVWSLDTQGHRIAEPVSRIVRRSVATPHIMIRLTLSDGRTLIAAPAHPSLDGTPFAYLTRGARIGGVTVSSVEHIMSVSPFTYDLLPAGPTGSYFANGIPVGSTLHRASLR